MTPSEPLSPISRGVQSTPGLLSLVPGVVNSVADALSLPSPRPLTVPTTLPSLTVPLPDHHSLTLQAPPVISTLVSDVASVASQGSSIISHAVSEGKSVLSLSPGSPLVPTALPTLTVPLPDHHSLTLQAPPVVSTLVSDVASAASQGSSIISHVVSEGKSVLESAGSSLASDLSNGLPTFVPLTSTIQLTQLPSLPLSISPLPSLPLSISLLPSPPLSSFQLSSVLPQPTSLLSSILSPSLPSASLNLSLPLSLPLPTSLPLTTDLSPSVISTVSSLISSALRPITAQNGTGPTINIPATSSLIPHLPTSSPTKNSLLPTSSPTKNSLLPTSSPSMGIPASTKPNPYAHRHFRFRIHFSPISLDYSSSASPSAILPATPSVYISAHCLDRFSQLTADLNTGHQSDLRPQTRELYYSLLLSNAS